MGNYGIRTFQDRTDDVELVTSLADDKGDGCVSGSKPENFDGEGNMDLQRERSNADVLQSPAQCMKQESPSSTSIRKETEAGGS